VNKVPFVDLSQQYMELKEETDAAIANVIKNTAYINGPDVKEFEGLLAEHTGTKYAVGVANATAALTMVQLALGIKKGDEVITTVHTAMPTAESIVNAGGKVRFVDIDPKTYCIDADKIETAITPNTKAIIPVHLYGIPANLEKIFAIAKKHNLYVIEDCAQAQGAMVGDKRVGSMGIAGCYSFFPSKNLGCMGDGGAMCTNDEKVATFVKMFSNHGRQSKFTHEIPGANERLDTLQAAVLKLRIKCLDKWNAHRRAVADMYAKVLADIPQITLPQTYPGTTPVWHLFVVRAERRDDLMTYLKSQGIGCGLHYPLPLHLQPAMAEGYKKGDFPEAEKATSEIVSLPMYGHMNIDDTNVVANAIREFYKSK